MEIKPNFEDGGKIIGPADGVEEIPKDGWISVSCTTKGNKSEEYIENLKSMYIELLNRFPQFRLKLSKYKNYPHWTFAKNDELLFNDMIINKKTYDDKISENYDLENHSCWRK